MPNGAQAPTEEGEASGGESQEEWDSDAAEDDDDDDNDEEDEEEEEEEVAPPRSEGGQNFPMTLRLNVARGLRLSRSRPNALRPLLRRRLKRRRSNPRWPRQSRPSSYQR